MTAFETNNYNSTAITKNKYEHYHLDSLSFWPNITNLMHASKDSLPPRKITYRTRKEKGLNFGSDTNAIIW